MIILDEKMLSKGTIGLIGEDYGIESPNRYDLDAYDKYIDKVVSIFYIGELDNEIDWHL